MLKAFYCANRRLVPLSGAQPLSTALWIDLFQPTAAEVLQIAELGMSVPDLAEMEEIEVSNRLFHEDGIENMTVVLPGQNDEGMQIAAPVCFMLAPQRLVTVRHHTPRPFDTYPERADKSSLSCASADRIFLSLIEDIIGRMADHLEGVGRGLDEVARQIYQRDPPVRRAKDLQIALSNLGAEGERLGRVRLALMTIGRAINHFGQTLPLRDGADIMGTFVTGLLRDIDALEVHAEFLSSRLALASDASLGMINLAQNGTVRIVSVVAVLFLPPTLIASIYGMNFLHMPELAQPWGYAMALGLMVGSAVVTWAFFHWRGWL